ncbi:hypothetical protein [Longirhabdus pacifica]|uniref:hypothetical protein n=1 Tax=Longirhabdus pacifica TaxID=2305227 RepID=UPI001008E46E|nr:hypothetical protein [Longirhabdus pacifica]
MDPFFLLIFPIIYLIFFIIDVRQLKQYKAGVKWTFYLIQLATFVLYLAMLLDVNVPVPTAFYQEKVTPWIESWLQPTK